MPGADGNRARKLIVLCVAAIGVGLAVFLTRAPLGALDAYRATIITAIWIYLPLPFILSTRKSPADYGIAFGSGLRGLAETTLAAVIVLIPFYLLFFKFMPIKWSFAQAFPAPIKILHIAALQLIIVAIPEEFFFRAFLQSELEAAPARKIRLLGADLGRGWVLASFVFAVGHVVVLATPLRVGVFFPALLFGWARSRTRSIIYPAIMHTIFNTTFVIASKMSGF